MVFNKEKGDEDTEEGSRRKVPGHSGQINISSTPNDFNEKLKNTKENFLITYIV